MMLLQLISVAWGRSDSARSYSEWESYVGLSQCQRSLHRCLQRILQKKRVLQILVIYSQ